MRRKGRKRRGKLKKGTESGGEDEALFSGDEEQKPRKVHCTIIASNISPNLSGWL